MEAIQITLPSSKSLSNRWLVLDYLSRNGVKIKNLSVADDTQLLKRLLRQIKMGRRHTFDCHDAGTAARFITALLAVTPGTHTVTGTERLCQRPMGPLFDALRSIGCQVRCTEKEGCLPVQIDGIVPTATRVVVDCSQSSQFASALLLMAASLPHGLAVELKNVSASEPYVHMTLEILRIAGINWTFKGNPPAYFVEHLIPNADAVSIEKDWSSASYFFEAVALRKGLRLHLSGLEYPSLQGDSALVDIFSRLGVVTEPSGLSLDVERTGDPCDTFVHDFLHTPDLVPAVAVTCAALGVDARLTGIANLRLKESDRVEAIVTELGKMGCKVEASQDELHLFPSELKVTQPVDPHNDHRIAMAFAVLKLVHPDVEVVNPEVVSKSFPAFFEMLERIV